MASQPGLRRTGKIRVTTPLATRPRPLRFVLSRCRIYKIKKIKETLACFLYLLSSEARDVCMVVGKAASGGPHPPPLVKPD